MMTVFGRSEIDSFFTKLKYRLDIWETTKKEVDLRLAGDFNVFDYIVPNEPLLSRIIADLLNPRGKHGQQATFLREFVRVLELPDALSLDDAIVKCEISTAHIERAYRKLDIEINFSDTFGIGIENKPWAVEQIRQLADYRDQLYRKFRDRFLLVYLTRLETPPETLSREELGNLRAKGQFRQMTFQREFVHWLTRCLKETQADNVRWFLRDFRDYVHARLVPEAALPETALGERQI